MTVDQPSSIMPVQTGEYMDKLKEFVVPLVRTDPRAGASAGFHAVVKAPDQMAAKHAAEGQYPGYRATSVRQITS